jgi:hypothetical protein
MAAHPRAIGSLYRTPNKIDKSDSSECGYMDLVLTSIRFFVSLMIIAIRFH